MMIKKIIDDRVRDNCGTLYVGTTGENEYCLARFDQVTEVEF